MPAAGNAARSRQFFDQFARDWNGFYASSGRMEPRIRRFLTAVQPLVPSGGRILDFGCGTGNLTQALHKAGFNASGADLSAGMIASAQTNYPGESSRFLVLQEDGSIPLPASSLQAITASSVLEYVPRIERTLAEFARTLSPGGVTIVTVPTVTHRVRRIEALAQSTLSLFRVARFANHLPWALRRRIEYLTISVNRYPIARWHSLFAAAGFSPLHVEGEHTTLVLLAYRKS